MPSLFVSRSGGPDDRQASVFRRWRSAATSGWRSGRTRTPGPPLSPGPGLTAQQTKEAVKLAKGAMTELRKKTEGANEPDADVREYVVNVELLVAKENPPTRPPRTHREGEAQAEKENEKGQERSRKPRARRAVGDLVSLLRRYHGFLDRRPGYRARRRRPGCPALPRRFPMPSSTRPRSWRVRKATRSNGSTSDSARNSASIPQFSQFTVKDDPRVHRVVHLNYRVGKRD